MNFKKYSPAVIIVLSLTMIVMGLLSLIWAFEIRTEIDSLLEVDRYEDLDPETKEQLQPKVWKFGIEFIFGIIMAPWGTTMLLSTIFNLKYKKIKQSRDRKATRFQTQFGLGLLIIAILISFSVQSMNDNRYEFMYLWGGLAMIGVIGLVIYREKNLHEIYDNDDTDNPQLDDNKR